MDQATVQSSETDRTERFLTAFPDWCRICTAHPGGKDLGVLDSRPGFQAGEPQQNLYIFSANSLVPKSPNTQQVLNLNNTELNDTQQVSTILWKGGIRPQHPTPWRKVPCGAASHRAGQSHRPGEPGFQAESSSGSGAGAAKWRCDHGPLGRGWGLSGSWEKNHKRYKRGTFLQPLDYR